MKKEVFIAIVIGLGLGLIVTYGIYTAQKTFRAHSNSVSESTPSATPNAANSTLVLLTPDDESVQSTADVKIAGTTIPESVVTIFVNDHQFITSADQSGNFSIDTQLDPNANVIAVQSIDEQGHKVQQQRTVIFANFSLDDVPSASFSATASSSAKSKTVKASPSPSPSSSGTSGSH